jgi:aryl-alcohol dehydrogenase-like predicted oxidoreductase
MTDITYRTLGRSGLRVSSVGLGGNNFGRPGSATLTQEGTNAVIDEAIELGVNFIDGADMYGATPGLSETLLGNALAGRRDSVVLATKFGHPAVEMGIPSWGAKASRRYIRLAVEQSLRRLRTDRIDLYQLHMPDPLTPIAETIDTLDDLVTAGKILYFGHSNLAGWQIAEAEFTAALAGRRHFVSAQNQYNLLSREVEREVLPAVTAFGLGFLPYLPLHNGLFTGKFTRAGGPADSRIMSYRPYIIDEAPWDRIEAFEGWAAERGITILQATFGWLLAQPGLTSVIAGATRPEQLRQNVAAAAWTPTADEVTEISALFSTEPVAE